MPGQYIFNVHWLEDEQFARWLTSVNDKNKARSKLCLKDIDIGNMGESALKRHAAVTKHKDLTKSLEKDPKVFLTLMLLTSNCKFQQQELDRHIWHSWKTKRSKRHNRLHERGNLSVMKWSN